MSEAPKDSLRPTNKFEVLNIMNRVIDRNRTCIKNNPHLPNSIAHPAASMKKSMPPLWSNRSTYGSLPWAIPNPIVLKILLSIPSVRKRGEVAHEYISRNRNDMGMNISGRYLLW